jgi:nitroimidazol reductase NimA-like FMN-containing flavoprotein (pyridoxamine 5'-phosphate oxidase superfamily)
MKELTFDQCEKILGDCRYGHLGFVADGEPHVVPVTYVYQYGYLYSFTHEGEKISAMRKHPNVCLQVEDVKNGNDWRSVICFGTFEEITETKEKRDIQFLLAEQYAHISMNENKAPVSPLIDDLHSHTTDDVKKSVIYRINIKKTTGREEKK